MVDQVRLMLVDDHQVIRQGLISLFESFPEFHVVAEAGDGQEAIEKALEVKPDVILMDVTMPVMDGFEATRYISENCKDCRVLALTVHEDKEFMLEMIEAGAWGFVTKRSLADDVVDAIKVVARGGLFLNPDFTRDLVDDFRRISRGHPSRQEIDRQREENEVALQKLSKREIEVIQLVSEGLTSEEIGKQLGITSKTVSRHRARIMEKLDISSTVGLVKFAIRTELAQV